MAKMTLNLERVQVRRSTKGRLYLYVSGRVVRHDLPKEVTDHLDPRGTEVRLNLWPPKTEGGRDVIVSVDLD